MNKGRSYRASAFITIIYLARKVLIFIEAIFLKINQSSHGNLISNTGCSNSIFSY